MSNLVELFCLVDDFCEEFIPAWQEHLLESGLKKRKRPSQLCPSEIMTILIHFHQSRYRDFKNYYIQYVQRFLQSEFSHLVSYSRFVELAKTVLVPLCFFTQSLSGEKTGVYFIDSTPIRSCHIKRTRQNRVFDGLAKIGRSSMGWFFGFKLHLVVNDKGEIMAFKLTTANTDDRKPVPHLVKSLTGKLFGDKGYISQKLTQQLQAKGLSLVTAVRKGMQNKVVSLMDKLLLRKRAIIESVNDQLKNMNQVEHTRHRSIYNFLGNLLAALAAYALQAKKPSLRGYENRCPLAS